MRIALDYDGTFDRDSAMWRRVVKIMQEGGHEVVVVTMRNKLTEELVMYPEGCQIYYSNRQAKRDYMNSLGILIDVWVDDRPDWIINDAGDRESL